MGMMSGASSMYGGGYGQSSMMGQMGGQQTDADGNPLSQEEL